MLRAGFIGAGRRASSAHFPAVARLPEVRMVAVSDLDPVRLHQIADRYQIPSRFTDYREMLAACDLDVVYIVLPPHLHRPVALDCLAAGLHVFVEKPPAMSVAELAEMAAAAERARRLTAVGFQRRFAAVVQAVRQRVQERGPVTLCLGEFHKYMLHRPGPDYGVSTLLDDIIHVVDLVRYLCGGEAVVVHACQDRFFADWTNCYNALIRFSTGSVGIVTGNRSAGARRLRCEVHGRGLHAEIEIPERADLWVENAVTPEVLTGPELVGSNDFLEYEGTLALHRHFVACLLEGRLPLTSFQECLGTMRLVEQIEGVAGNSPA